MKINKVLELVKSKLEFEASGHDYTHALRVRKNALALCQNYKVDQSVVEVASLVHDLLDHKLDEIYKLTIEELEVALMKIGYQEHDITHICRIITNMSYSTGLSPETIEGKIVQDADRLDALGAIGIARTFSYGGRNGRLIYGSNDGKDSVNHFHDKLFNLAKLMNTKEGKILAKERTDFMEEFLNQLNKEIK